MRKNPWSTEKCVSPRFSSNHRYNSNDGSTIKKKALMNIKAFLYLRPIELLHLVFTTIFLLRR